MNHMRERHLDGTVLISGAGGTVFESLARPDLLITDAERANVIGGRRKDRDAALIGTTSPPSRFPLLIFYSRYHHYDPFFAVFFTSSLRRQHSRPRIARIARSTLVLCTSQVSNMSPLAHGPRNAHLCAKYDGVAWRYGEQGGCGRGDFWKAQQQA
jgi:hypothetical protein